MGGPQFDRLIDAPKWWAEHTPDASVTWFEGVETTYAALDAAADTYAHALVAAGVAKGDRVAVLSTPRPAFLIAMLGIQRAGAIYVGVNPSYTRREQLHVLNDSRPVLLLSIDSFGGRDYAEALNLNSPHRDIPFVAAARLLVHLGLPVPLASGVVNGQTAAMRNSGTPWSFRATSVMSPNVPSEPTRSAVRS